MRIYTRVVIDWDGNVLEFDGYDYSGPVALACGAPAGQTQLASEQANFYQQLTQNATAEFGAASSLVSEFNKEYGPIFAAGPNQKGWNGAESAAINSNIVTGEGQATKNAMQASLGTTDALGGGNEYTPEGAVKEGKAAINVAGAQATAQSQQNALIQNYQQGFQNFELASSALGSTPQMYAGSSTAAGAATGAGSAADTSYSNIAAEDMSPLSLVGGALGASGGALAA